MTKIIKTRKNMSDRTAGGDEKDTVMATCWLLVRRLNGNQRDGTVIKTCHGSRKQMIASNG